MQAKYKRMKIALISMAVAMVIFIGGAIGVFAAISQSMSTKFTVKYSVGQNVGVSIGTPCWKTFSMPNRWETSSGEFYITSMGGTPPMDQDEGWYKLDADRTEDYYLSAEATGDNTEEIMLVYEDCLIVCFYFRNLMDKDIQVSISDYATKENISIYHYYKIIEDSSYFLDPYDTSYESLFYAHIESDYSGDTRIETSFTLAGGEMGVFAIVVQVLNPNIDAICA